jgi:hypothetical protein
VDGRGQRAEGGGGVKERADDGVVLMVTREPCWQCESEEGEGVGVSVEPWSCGGHVGSGQGERRSQWEGKGKKVVVGEQNAGRKKLTCCIDPSSASSLLTARVILLQTLIQPQHGHSNHSRSTYFSHLPDSFHHLLLQLETDRGKI